MRRNHAISVLQTIDNTGHLILRGAKSLALLRDAIRVAVRQAGVTVEFDPSSEPNLTDYLAIAGVSTLERAAGGALLGLLVGGVLGRPDAGLLLGVGLGATSGLTRGISLVRRGWRVRASLEADGTPLLQVVAE